MKSATSLSWEETTIRTSLDHSISRNKTELAEFLKQIPFISHWSITQLSKLSEIVQKVSLIRNQFVIKEKEPLKYVYMIRSGEFEITKSYPKVDKHLNKADYKQRVLKPMLRVADSFDDRERQTHNSALQNALFVSPRMQIFFNAPKLKRVAIGSLSKGQIFWENDAQGDKVSSVSVKWSTSKGEVFQIRLEDFLSYLKRDPEAWKKFTKHSILKNNEINSRISTYQKQFKNFGSNKKIEAKTLKSFLRDQNPNEIDIRRTMKQIVK